MIAKNKILKRKRQPFNYFLTFNNIIIEKLTIVLVVCTTSQTAVYLINNQI